MSCTNPVDIVNRRRGTLMSVPCGRCVACRHARAREWAVRCMHECDVWDCSCFATLTFADEYLPADGALDKSCLQRFFKRLRRRLDNRRIKYFAAGEYGDHTYRPHYHAVIFGVSVADTDVVTDAWGFGFVSLGTVTFASCRYVTGYINKSFSGPVSQAFDFYGGRQPPFQICSHALGLDFVLKNRDQLLQDLDLTVQGVHVPLPRYYYNHLDVDPTVYYSRGVESYLAYQERLGDSYPHELRNQTDINLRSKFALYKRKL